VEQILLNAEKCTCTRINAGSSSQKLAVPDTQVLWKCLTAKVYFKRFTDRPMGIFVFPYKKPPPCGFAQQVVNIPPNQPRYTRDGGKVVSNICPQQHTSPQFGRFILIHFRAIIVPGKPTIIWMLQYTLLYSVTRQCKFVSKVGSLSASELTSSIINWWLNYGIKFGKQTSISSEFKSAGPRNSVRSRNFIGLSHIMKQNNSK